MGVFAFADRSHRLPVGAVMLIAIRTVRFIDLIPFIGWAVGITFLVGALG